MPRMLVLALVTISTVVPAAAQGQSTRTLASIFAEIQNLEGANDPKCDATASRLEDFIYGTPLTDAARFRKNELQKALIRTLWLRASPLVAADDRASVSEADIQQVAADLLVHEQRADGGWDIAGPEPLTVDATDKRQYSSIAYALRAMLAVQQDRSLDSSTVLPPLDPEAVTALKDFTDIYTLSALQIADRRSRLEGRLELRPIDLAGC